MDLALCLLANFYIFDILVLIPLIYISICVYYGLFKVKIFGLFGLYKYHQTDAPSLMFYSINFARVSAPISYNYLKILGLKNSCFEKIIGTMDEVPILGQANAYFFPMILIILILFNLFDVYKKILQALGLEQFDFSDNFDHQKINAGKGLLQKARNQWEKQFEIIKSQGQGNLEGYNNASSLRKHKALQNIGREYSSNKSQNYIIIKNSFISLYIFK
ncbi:lmbr1-like conserved region family protein, putative [Ichthyophthirius multifiliis]|uniref:Lmbr1-like conserved region family protein, putative n=1 Tax=Ichthyophthirius multifiliis TaxID=5932 RepID=G0QVJ9_ICHMU|nr:lmbr1-like conserved region family protein, putative [Ichthyophthirius multifiliis]EGR30759.1 lmbr1-like conserved region family protein, putative [Ichthyophthirius multifiliis]|eukprot:XP_004032346.1 lmbr1-like conserved region family protein, putative [Ichthyophthirius multifiliis]